MCKSLLLAFCLTSTIGYSTEGDNSPLPLPTPTETTSVIYIPCPDGTVSFPPQGC